MSSIVLSRRSQPKAWLSLLLRLCVLFEIATAQASLMVHCSVVCSHVLEITKACINLRVPISMYKVNCVYYIRIASIGCCMVGSVSVAGTWCWQGRRQVNLASQAPGGFFV